MSHPPASRLKEFPIASFAMIMGLAGFTTVWSRAEKDFALLFAPPAVGFLSYLNLVGGLDAFARVLSDIALFFAAFLLVRTLRLARLKFFLSWWAYSFPLAAITVATLVMAGETGARGYLWLGGGLLGLLTLVVLLLLVRTGLAVARRDICVEGP